MIRSEDKGVVRLFDVDQQLLVALQREVQIGITRKRGLFAGGLIFVVELNRLTKRNPQAVQDSVVESSERDIRGDLDGDNVAIVAQLHLHLGPSLLDARREGCLGWLRQG